MDEYEFYEVSCTKHLFFFDAACFNCFHVLIFQMQKVENGDFNWIIPGVCHQMNLCGIVWGDVSLSSNECECES